MIGLFKKKNDPLLGKLEELTNNLNRIGLNMVGSDTAKLVNSEKYFDITTDEYSQCGGNLSCRRFTGKDDIRSEDERQAEYYLKTLNFERFVVIGTKFTKDSFLEPHFHNFPEKIFIISGIAQIKKEGHNTRSGHYEFLNAFQVHQFIGLEEGYCITTIPKSNDGNL